MGHAIPCLIPGAAVGFTIVVHQDSRRQGLGVELTRLAIDLATRRGFAEILLSTEISNFPAMSLDEKNGFETKSVYGEECGMRLARANASRVRDRVA